MACFMIPWVGIYLLPLDCLELAQLNHDNLGTDQPGLEAENHHADPSERGRFLPLLIHNHPRFTKTSRRLARVRETPFMQKALNICQTFLGSFFGVALGHCNRNCCNANLQCNVSVAVDSPATVFFCSCRINGRQTSAWRGTLPTVYRLGWFYVAQIAASSAIMLAWGLIIILASGGTRVSLHFWLDGPTLRRSQLF